MSYDTPMTAAGQAIQNLPVREQLRRGLKDMGSRSFSSAKNFGIVGAMFSGTECCIEGVSRAAGYRYVGWFTDMLVIYVVPSQKRYEERYSRWVHHWRCSGSEGRTTGCGYRVCGFRGVQYCD